MAVCWESPQGLRPAPLPSRPDVREDEPAPCPQAEGGVSTPRAKPSRFIWEGTVLPFVVACPPHAVRQTGVPHAGAVHPWVTASGSNARVTAQFEVTVRDVPRQARAPAVSSQTADGPRPRLAELTAPGRQVRKLRCSVMRGDQGAGRVRHGGWRGSTHLSWDGQHRVEGRARGGNGMRKGTEA